MFTDRFSYAADSGSRIQVIDPITNQTKEGYISSFPSASSFIYYQELFPDKVWDVIPKDLVWVNHLQKFLIGGLGANGNPDTMSLSINVVNGEERSKWSTASLDGVFPAYGVPSNLARTVENIVCSDELSRCVATTYSGDSVITSSIIYSDDGYMWYTSSFSKITNITERRILDMAWSPTTNTFVGLGLSSSLREASPGFFVTDAKEYTVTSSNGIDWHFTVVSESLKNRNLNYRNITWSPTYNKFLIYGDAGYDAGLYSASLYSSSNGVSWGIVTSHSFGSSGPAQINKLTEQNGILIGIGYSNYNTSTLIYSSNLTTWSAVDTKHIVMHDITYVPQKNKYFAAGQSGSGYSANKLTIATSSNLTEWGTFLVDPRVESDASNFQSVAWSSDSSSSIFTIGREFGAPYWLYSDDNNLPIYYRIDDDTAAYVSFENEPGATLLNTPLLAWTSSIDSDPVNSGLGLVDTDWLPFNSDTSYSWVEFDLATGADFPTGNDSYIPTSSYGIIIDSQSLQYFTSTYYGSFTEDVMVGDVRYLREISQSPGGEYATSNYGYYETPISSTVHNTATSSFSAALKADGRDYVNVYYGIYGDNYMGEDCAMILNLNNGTVEYFEDATNWNAPGSYYMVGQTKLKFLEGPTLTAKDNDYWQLYFKVGFDRGNRTRSGSLTLT